MIDDARTQRYRHAAQVGRQALQLLRVAARTPDRRMRDELCTYARRMSAHALWLWNGVHEDDARSVQHWSEPAAARL